MATRRGRILVIDDEVAVGKSIARMLRDDHDVEVVTEGAAALSRIAAGARYDVIFCDLMMPGLSGLDVHEALSARHPELARRLVFVTAGAFEQAGPGSLGPAGNVLLRKPFTLDEIRSAAARGVAEAPRSTPAPADPGAEARGAVGRPPRGK